MYWLRYLLKEPYHALSSPMGRAMLQLFRKYADTPRYQPITVHFLNYTFDVPDAFSFCWQFKEIFVDESYRFDSTNEKPVILDCGSNVGLSILYLKKRFPNAQITAFEADPQIAQYLHKNLKNNGITGVEVIEKAVWIHNQGVSFASEGADGGSVAVGGKTQEIPSIRLAEVLPTYPKIDFLKMDIEGAETAVIPDCREVISHIQHLFVEYHSYLGERQHLGELLTILTDKGFRYYVDTNQHRMAPFVNRTYKDNQTMDLQLNIFANKSTNA